MASVRHWGNWAKTTKFLERAQRLESMIVEIDALAQKGVDRLKEATPVRTGLTRDSWQYEIKHERYGSISIEWQNTHIEKGYAKIALLINDGHGTGTGGYVPGINYIDSAIQPVMDEIVETFWKAVTMHVG